MPKMDAVVVVVLALGISLGAWVSDEELLQKADEARFIDAESYTVLLDVIAERLAKRPDGSEERTQSEALLRIYNKLFPEGVRTRVEFLEPEAMHGTVYLIVGEDIFLWQPGLLQPIKISGQQKLFGDASVAEAAGISFQEYEVQARGETELNGQRALKLELTAKNSSQAFPRVTLWLDPEDLRPLQTVLAALSETPLKRVTYAQYATFEEDEYAAEIVVEDLLFQGNKTTMRTEEITIEELDDALFDPNQLGSSND